jgi:hypothetical protein
MKNSNCREDDKAIRRSIKSPYRITVFPAVYFLGEMSKKIAIAFAVFKKYKSKSS